jgi:hypothetical protein
MEVTNIAPLSIPKVIRIDLTEEEAEIIALLCVKVAGDPKHSKRSVTDELAREFKSKGINYDIKWLVADSDYRNGINMKDLQ